MKQLLTFSFAFICMLALNAQHTNILITDQWSPEEPSITLNPKNPDIMVGGCNIYQYFYSTDGGYTWENEEMTSPYGVWGDPCLIVDTAGHYYFFHLSNPQNGSWIDRIVAQKSTDHGQTWTSGNYMGLNGSKAQDKEWAAVDWSNNNIYVTWTQFDEYGSGDPQDSTIIRFSKSTDAGASWSEAMRINEVAGNCIDSDNTVEGAVPAVGPEGQIYVAWAGPAGLVFDKSYDQGETWLDKDIFIDEFPGGWDYDIPGISRCNGLPVTSCDTSGGPYNGTIYVNWTDQRHGEDDTDVWLAKSTDEGETWSDPIRVNDDPPGKHQFFTWMTVDQATGYLYFVFYDRRNYDDKATDVYMAMSKDGGETFTNFKISESPFAPNSGVFFGDYTNITAYDDVIRPIWARLDGFQLTVYTAIVDPNIVGIEKPEEDMPFALGQNYPNPFSNETYISFKLHEPSRITLKIYDMYGRKVTTLIDNEKRTFGKYVETFNPKQHGIETGVYYYSLTSREHNLKKKMVFNR